MKFAFIILLFSSIICKISSASDLKKFTDDEILNEYKKRFHSKKDNHNKNRQHRDTIQSIRKMMEADQSMFNNFFNDDTFFRMNKKMKEMMQRFTNENNSSFLKQQQKSLSDITYSWEETSKDIILKINLNSKKDQDIIVKIDGASVILSQSQKVEQKNKTKNGSSFGRSISSFKQSIRIPDGVDSNKAIMNNNNNEIIIHFPKRSKKAIPLKYDNDNII